jgi:uncharacterized protein YcbX
VTGVLSGIYVYPIKSCRAVSCDTATVSTIGLHGDRIWQVVDDERRGITQRRHRVLATVQPEPREDGGLRLIAPNQPTIEIDPPGARSTTVKSHFGVPVPACDAGDEAAAWFTDLTGEAVRLVAMVRGCGWRLPDDLDIFGQNAPFSDAAPILVTADSSLTWLRERASEAFGMDRFRPNLVVSDTAPWEEDTWRTFMVGHVELRAAAPWPRCEIPQIDQTTTDRHREPAKVLRRHRWCAEAPSFAGPFRRILEGSGLFGIGCSIGPPGATLRVGDEVVVTTTAPPVLTTPSEPPEQVVE